MINRRNWQDVEAHLAYRRDVHRDATTTQATRRAALRMLLLWADARALTEATAIRPTFPEYVAAQRREGQRLAATTQEGVVSAAKTFFQWGKVAQPRRYRGITPLWLASLRPVPGPAVVKERQVYTLEDVRRLVAVPAESMKAQRIRAAVAWLFLSGMRIGAFVTLPIAAVDVERREVRQWTGLGVRTKFGKSATTFLLEVPDLLAVAAAWDALMRSRFRARAMWYPNLAERPGQKDVVEVLEASPGRARSLRRDLAALCEAAGVPYRSPHKFRHGHVVHALNHARSPADLKAISQNVMHANLATTDGIYGVLQDHEVAARVGRMGGQAEGSPTQDVVAELERLLVLLRGE